MRTNPTPVGGPTAWTPSTLREQDWLRHIDQPPTATATRTRPEFHLPALTLLAERAKAALEAGPGLVVVRGWPIADWPEEQIDLLCYTFGSLIGTPRTQKAGVVTTGENSRRGMDDQELAVHTDRGGPPGPPHLLGLLCLRAAVRGGESLLVSGHAVHDRLLKERPDLLAELYENLRFPLCPGDLLFVNNDVVLHGRTAFTEDPRARRRLARIWLD